MCQQVIMASFDNPTNLKVCMLCCGILYIIGGFYTWYYVPETVNPDTRVGCEQSGRLFSKGLWRQDCRFVENLKKVLNQSASLRVYALWFNSAVRVSHSCIGLDLVWVPCLQSRSWSGIAVRAFRSTYLDVTSCDFIGICSVRIYSLINKRFGIGTRLR